MAVETRYNAVIIPQSVGSSAGILNNRSSQSSSFCLECNINPALVVQMASSNIQGYGGTIGWIIQMVPGTSDAGLLEGTIEVSVVKGALLCKLSILVGVGNGLWFTWWEWRRPIGVDVN